MYPRHAALLVALASIWGASYLLIKYALADFSPPFIVWARLVIALAVLCGALLATGRADDLRAAARDVRRRPATAALLGLLAIALPFTLITVGELHVPSGLTAVLIAPASMFVAMLAPLLDASERADARAVAGMGIGLAGVVLLVGVESVQSLGEFLGSLAMLAAALSYALGGFVAKRRYAALSPLATSTVSIAAATLLIAPLGLATVPEALPGWRASLAVLALGGLGTALAFVIFYNLVAAIGAGRASLVSYLAPAVALVYGAWLLDEAVTWAALVGLALILCGVALASAPRRAAPGAAVSRAGD
jgi:drug/metabolite transporter (DMT)-like permease